MTNLHNSRASLTKVGAADAYSLVYPSIAYITPDFHKDFPVGKGKIVRVSFFPAGKGLCIALSV